MNEKETVCFQVLKEIDANAMAVYLILLSNRNKETNKCELSISEIIRQSNMSESTIKRTREKLYRAGYIDIDSEAFGKPSKYYFPKEPFYQDFKNDEDQNSTTRRTTIKKTLQQNSVPGIYLISNTITHTQYVGQAVDVRKRWVEHIRDLRNNTHCNKSLQADFNQYGEESFEFKILETIEDSPILDIELDRKEGYWGKKLNVLSDGYNEAKFHDPFKD